MLARIQLLLSRSIQWFKQRKKLNEIEKFVTKEKTDIEKLTQNGKSPLGTLIIKCDDLGDFMMWHQVIPNLEKHAAKPITFVGNLAAKPIILNWFDFADHYIWVDKQKWKEPAYRLELYKEMVQLHAKVAISTLFTRNFQLDDLLLYASKANERIAWSVNHHAYFPQLRAATNMSNKEVVSQNPILLECHRNIEFINLVFKLSEPLQFQPLFPHFKKQNRLVVFPVANAASRCWPHENFISTLIAIKNHFDQVILIGGGNAIETCNKIAQGVADERVVNLCGETQMTELFPLIGESDVLLTVDSFALHIGVNTQTNIVVIANGTNWQRFTDYTAHVKSQFEVVYPPYFNPKPNIVKLTYSRSEIKSIKVPVVVKALQKVISYRV